MSHPLYIGLNGYVVGRPARPPAEWSPAPISIKKVSKAVVTLETLFKEGSFLLSRIALQYHRRKRA